MEKILQKTLWISLLLTMVLGANEAILKIDSGGHQGRIWNIKSTKSGDIISSSNDKTIRIWDSKSGIEKRKVLGEIGSGSNGRISSIALSNDEKLLAVGGAFSSNEIRIYDYQNGKLLELLKSHNGFVTNVEFDKEGTLYSASLDNTVKIWKLIEKKYILSKTLTEHSNATYSVKTLNNGSFVSVGWDNKIILYDRKGVVKTYTHKEKLQYLAVSNQYIVACGGFDDEILVFDKNLNLQKTIINANVPMGLAFSPNEEKLIVGSNANIDNSRVTIYDVNDNFKVFKTFATQEEGTISAVSFLDNDTIVSAGGIDFSIFISSLKSNSKSKIISGNGNIITNTI